MDQADVLTAEAELKNDEGKCAVSFIFYALKGIKIDCSTEYIIGYIIEYEEIRESIRRVQVCVYLHNFHLILQKMNRIL